MKLLTNDEFAELLKDAQIEQKFNSHLRIGQILFNNLYESNPELANSVRGTSADPFYASDINDKRVHKFMEEVIE